MLRQKEWNAKRVRTMRARFGLTLEQFSRVVGVSWFTIYRWEHGIALPLRENEIKLTAAERRLERKGVG